MRDCLECQTTAQKAIEGYRRVAKERDEFQRLSEAWRFLALFNMAGLLAIVLYLLAR